MVAANKGRGLDASSRAMLFEGANLSELGVLFRMDHRQLVEKLHGVNPSGQRGRAAIYSVHEVAPYLVKPMYDIEKYIKRMSHSDLPKILTKEFWAGQRSKQEYLLKEAHLWPTAKVVENVGELLKIMKMTAALATDNLERSAELTDKQRDTINGVLRGMLEETQRMINEKFTLPESDDEDDSDTL